jgi:hypothetical protein
VGFLASDLCANRLPPNGMEWSRICGIRNIVACYQALEGSIWGVGGLGIAWNGGCLALGRAFKAAWPDIG